MMMIVKSAAGFIRFVDKALQIVFAVISKAEIDTCPCCLMFNVRVISTPSID